MRIDFLGLQAFISIAERGSFHRAAVHLNLSQTALSHRVRKLESELGVPLLVRTTRRVSLTRAGLDLLPRARQAMDEIVGSLEEVRQRGRDSENYVHFACLSSIAARYLPLILPEFRKKYPKIKVSIFDSSAAQVREMVQMGKAEFGLTISGADSWDMDVSELITDAFVLVCPRDHPLAALDIITWQDLIDQPMIKVSPPTGSWALLDEALRDRRDAENWDYDVQQVATALELVAAGEGVAVLPQLSIDRDKSPTIICRPLADLKVSRTLCFVSKRGEPLSPAADDIKKLIAEAILKTNPVQNLQKKPRVKNGTDGK